MATDQELLELLDLPADLGRIQPGEATVELSEEERRFQEERKTTLGGTDQAAHLGFSSYRNAWDVAAEKKGLLEPWGGNERTDIGRLLEEPIAREYAKRTGQRLRKCNEVVRDRIHDFLGGHPDRLVIGAPKGVEIKTIEYGKEKWSLPGEPVRVPRDYYVQSQHYMMITGRETWDLVGLFGLSRIRWYTLERNEIVIRALREKGQEFWEKYVLGPDLPPIEGKRAERWLRDRYPAPTGPTYVVANEEQRETIARWREAKGKAALWKKEEEKLKLHVQAAIGDAEGILAGETTVTWKKDKDSTALVTDYAGLLAHYAEAIGFQIQAEDIQKFTRSLVTRQGARKLLPKEAK
jgi:putative phage-type endonuclease